jgi:hypothetical protein
MNETTLAQLRAMADTKSRKRALDTLKGSTSGEQPIHLLWKQACRQHNHKRFKNEPTTTWGKVQQILTALTPPKGTRPLLGFFTMPMPALTVVTVAAATVSSSSGSENNDNSNNDNNDSDDSTTAVIISPPPLLGTVQLRTARAGEKELIRIPPTITTMKTITDDNSIVTHSGSANIDNDDDNSTIVPYDPKNDTFLLDDDADIPEEQNGEEEYTSDDEMEYKEDDDVEPLNHGDFPVVI